MKRLLVVVVLALLVVAGAWLYAERAAIEMQWALYRVGSSADFTAARAELAWFDSGSERDVRQQQLVRAWGTGNPRFDLYVAQYLGRKECSDALRQALSLEFAWRPEKLPRWGHYWSWRAAEAPDVEARSVLSFLETLAAADETPRALTWREVLDAQAVLTLHGRSDLAVRLTPENWKQRLERFRNEPAQGPEKIPRPQVPMPDWEGPA